ncbi:conserved Plasmodium protein, unknown function [Plasmodium ovale curtisi]|uniref:Uncharacterized protein n=1 Tax=Plasmodium ovale curtisi TaxID=864141 RepID=A0A1A8VLR6_PLAOA|nr:conserved Plasmodium protein, unknown function [Plasmodium ovale curtisi]
MTVRSYVFLLLLFEALFTFLLNREDGPIAMANCDVLIVGNSEGSDVERRYIHLGKNYKEEDEKLNETNKKEKKRDFFPSKREKNRIMNNVAHKKNLFLQSVHKNTTATDLQMLFLNSNVRNKKKDFKMYKTKNVFYEPLQRVTFLEISKHLFNKIEGSSMRDRTHLTLPEIHPIIPKKHRQYSLLEDDENWIEVPALPISCRETGCPNSYQMCIPLYVDENNFGGKSISSIVEHSFDVSRNAGLINIDGRYSLNYYFWFSCVCKKYIADGQCDESVVGSYSNRLRVIPSVICTKHNARACALSSYIDVCQRRIIEKSQAKHLAEKEAGSFPPNFAADMYQLKMESVSFNSIAFKS